MTSLKYTAEELDISIERGQKGVVELEATEARGLACTSVMLRCNSIRWACIYMVFDGLKPEQQIEKFVKVSKVTWNANADQGENNDTVELQYARKGCTPAAVGGSEVMHTIRIRAKTGSCARADALRLAQLCGKVLPKGLSKLIPKRDAVKVQVKKTEPGTPIKVSPSKTPRWNAGPKASPSSGARSIFSPVMPWNLGNGTSRGHRLVRRRWELPSPLKSPRREIRTYSRKKFTRISPVQRSPSKSPKSILARRATTSPKVAVSKTKRVSPPVATSDALPQPKKIKRNLHARFGMAEDQKSGAISKFFAKKKTQAVAPILSSADLPQSMPCIGMPNLGNSCYMNASLQSLMYLRTFSCEISSTTWKSVAEDNTKRLPLFRALLDLDSQISSRTAASSDVLRSIKSALAAHDDRFQSFRQQDAHEFVCAFLDVLSMELGPQAEAAASAMALDAENRDTNAAQGTILAELLSKSIPAEKLEPFLEPTARNFSSAVGYTIKCKGCNYEREKVEYFRDFSLQISTGQGDGKDASSLESMLKDYFASEDLDELKCEKCGHVGASCAFSIKEVPEVLILHVKRFAMDPRKYGSYVKRFDRIVPPQTLDLANITGSSSSDLASSCKMQWASGEALPPCSKYSLQSIVHHKGASASSGHYTATVRVDGEWYDIDDGQVCRAKREPFNDPSHQATAYLLMYVAKRS